MDYLYNKHFISSQCRAGQVKSVAIQEARPQSR